MPSRPRLRIFCCDDDAAMLLLLRQWLDEHERFEVIGDADETAVAFRRARELAPDVIITDLLRGPRDAGFLPSLRRAAPRALLVVYSGYERWQLAPDVVSRADDFVTKGTDGERLIAALERLAKR